MPAPAADAPFYLPLPGAGAAAAQDAGAGLSFEPGSLLKQVASAVPSYDNLPSPQQLGYLAAKKDRPVNLPLPPGLEAIAREKASLDSLPTAAWSDEEGANGSETDSTSSSRSPTRMQQQNPFGVPEQQQQHFATNEQEHLHMMALAAQRLELMVQQQAVLQEQEKLNNLRKELAAGLARLSAPASQNPTMDSLPGVMNMHGMNAAESPMPAAPQNEVTLMMGNLSSKYTQQSLLEEIDGSGFAGTYDFFYLPIDAATKTNRAYAFINLHDEEAAKAFQDFFHGRKMRLLNSGKCTTVKVAALQGFEANYAHFAHSRVANRGNPHSRPLFLREAQKNFANKAQHGAKQRPSQRNAAASRAEKYAQNSAAMQTNVGRKGANNRDTSFCPTCGVPKGASFQFCVNCRASFV